MKTMSDRTGTYERFCAAVDGPMAILTLAWLPVLIIPLVVPLHGSVAETFDLIDYFIWALFSVEYFVKLYLSRRRWQFFRTHLLDLLIVAVPMFRPLRALRLVRLARLARIGAVLFDGLKRMRAILAHRGLHFVLLAATAIVVASAAVVLNFEIHAKGSNIHNFPDALWWAVVTVTTVGYGDHYPVSAAGRGVAVMLMLVGIGLIGVLTATVASFFLERQSADADERLDAMQSQLDAIEGLLRQIAAQGEPQALTSSELAVAGNGSTRRGLDSLRIPRRTQTAMAVRVEATSRDVAFGPT